MRQLLVVVGAVAATLVPAAPASSGSVPEGGMTSRPADQEPAPRLLPPRLLTPPEDQDGCVLPVGSSLMPCPPGEGPPVSCIIPVTELPPGVTIPDPCRTPRQPPESRVVPILPPATYPLNEE